MDKLIITTCLADNTHKPAQTIADYIGQRLGIRTELAVDIPWRERERLLDAGQIHMGWVCGLLYVWKADRQDSPLELLAAPIMRDPRYREQPIYYSDVIVRQDSPYRTFKDLKDCRWAYNEPGSYSGYYIVCHHLLKLGESLDFFSQRLESGAHLNSIKMLVDGQVDATAIDSTVLDYEMVRQPVLAHKLRVIETLGPSPIPPWVISVHIPGELRRRLRELLLNMHQHPTGRALLADGQLLRFTDVADADYQSIRDVAKEARPIAQSA